MPLCVCQQPKSVHCSFGRPVEQQKHPKPRTSYAPDTLAFARMSTQSFVEHCARSADMRELLKSQTRVRIKPKRHVLHSHFTCVRSAATQKMSYANLPPTGRTSHGDGHFVQYRPPAWHRALAMLGARKTNTSTTHTRSNAAPHGCVCQVCCAGVRIDLCAFMCARGCAQTRRRRCAVTVCPVPMQAPKPASVDRRSVAFGHSVIRNAQH